MVLVLEGAYSYLGWQLALGEGFLRMAGGGAGLFCLFGESWGLMGAWIRRLASLGILKLFYMYFIRCCFSFRRLKALFLSF